MREDTFGVSARRLAALFALLVTMLLVGAGCGDDDDDTQGGAQGGDGGASSAKLEEARQIVEEASAPVEEFSGPTEPVPVPENRHVLILNCAAASVGCSSQVRGAEEAVRALGWKATVIDGKGDPNRYNDAIQQGISLGVDGMILASINQQLIQNSLTDAKDAGIRMVSQWSGNIGPSAEYVGKEDAEPGPNTVEAEIPQPDLQVARGMAAYAVTETEGDAHVLMLTTPEYPNEQAKAQAFEKDLADLCPDCEIVDTQQVNQAQATTQVPQTVKARLSSNPDINVIWVPYDDIGILANQGVREAGRAEDVSIVGTVGIAPALKEICDEEGAFKATFAEAANWPGHASTDALLRLFDGQEVTTPEMFEQYTTPVRLITQESCGALSTEGNWTAEYSIPEAWQEVWGVG